MGIEEDNLDDLIGPAPSKAIVPEVLGADDRDNKGRFKPGWRGGPGPKPSISNEVASLTRAEMQNIGKLLLQKDYDGIRDIKNDPTESMFRVMLASVCLKVVERGDMHALDILLNRLIGKVRDEIAVHGDSFLAPQIIVQLPANGREAKDE